MTTFVSVLLGTLLANIIIMFIARHMEHAQHRKQMEHWQKTTEEIRKTYDKLTKKEVRAEA